MRSQSFFYALASIGALLLASPTVARTFFVADTGDGSDGLTWETAFQQINDAVVVAVTDDEIRVKEALYRENVILATPVVLVGGFVGNETANGGISKTIQRCSVINPLSAGYVVEIRSDSSIRGFVISGSFGLGGEGIAIVNATAELVKCTSSFNNGRGVGCLNSVVTIRGCTITNNINEFEGGGIICLDSKVTFVDCIVANNIAVSTGLPVPQPGMGGGLSVIESPVTLINCLFYGNEAGLGSDIHSYGTGAIVNCLNCIFASTESPSFRGIFSGSEVGHFLNCVVWGHPTSFVGTPDWKVDYSVFRGGFSGEGNIDADPLFVDPDNGNFRLQAGSPCIDSASTTGPTTDLDGNARPLDVPGVGRDGTGDEFDMGAYEFVPTPAPTLLNERSDINQSGKVDAKDVLILLADWKKVTDAVTN